jgi:DNA-binding NarL/FixJ family response regulator
MYINIAYVEDNPLDITIIKRTLYNNQPEGYVIRYQLDEYITLHDALIKLYARNPDIVLLDLNLPDSTGFDTFHQLSATVKSPIIVLSGMTDLELSLQCMREGAAGYLAKDWIKDNPLLLHFNCLHIHQLYRQQVEIQDFIQERLGKFRPLIPRCKWCEKRIGTFSLRDESNNEWFTYENYFRRYGINFTDGACEECMKEMTK